VAYVVVILWLVSANFRSAASAAASSGGQGVARYLNAISGSIVAAHRRRRSRRKAATVTAAGDRQRAQNTNATALAGVEGHVAAAGVVPTASGVYRCGDQYFEVEESVLEEDDFAGEEDEDEEEFRRCVEGDYSSAFYDEEEDEEEDMGIDGPETEALLVTQDERGKKRPRCTTVFGRGQYQGEPV